MACFRRLMIGLMVVVRYGTINGRRVAVLYHDDVVQNRERRCLEVLYRTTGTSVEDVPASVEDVPASVGTCPRQRRRLMPATARVATAALIRSPMMKPVEAIAMAATGTPVSTDCIVMPNA